MEPAHHQNWVSDGVQLAFGEKPEGQILHISQVPTGLACECKCPACGTPLIAKNGSIPNRGKAHHFAHYNNKECKTASETALHRYAKQLLVKTLHVTLPALSASSGKFVKQVVRAKKYDFDEAIEERRIEDVVADVCFKKGMRELLVEVRVTHACDEQKIAKLSRLNIAAFEIDLSQSRTSDIAEIDYAILHGARRSWLFHPHLAKTMVELQDQRDRTLRREQLAREKELEEDRKRARRKIEQRERNARTIANALKNISPRDQEFDRMLIANLESAGYKDCIGLDIVGDCAFTVSRRAWQAAVLNTLIDTQSGRWRSSDLGMEWLYKQLKKDGLIHRICNQFIDTDLVFSVQANGCDFENPYRVVWNYLEMLSKRGLCYSRGNRWTPSLNRSFKTSKQFIRPAPNSRTG